MKKSKRCIQNWIGTNNQFKHISLIKFVFTSLSFIFSINLIAQPVIGSFTPSSGAIGTSVTINGSGFNITPINNIVYFGATVATVTAATATSISVIVPAGATYQPISVLNTANNLTGYSASPFNVTFNIGNGQTITSSSFNSLVDFTTGTNPFSVVAISDIDGDGKPDMVVTNEYSNTFSVLRNMSTPGSITTTSFATKVDFATDSTPGFVAIDDIDGDGKPDVVITNSFTNTISIFRNIGFSGSITSSSFTSKVDFITDTLSLPSSIAIGDLDGDGKPDIVVTNLYNNTVSVLKNTSSPGSISFAAPVDLTVGLGPNFAAIVDIDGDGKPDIVVANYNSKTVSVLRNISAAGVISTSSFATHIDFVTNTGPYSFSVADINNDSKPDLIIANQGSNNISALINNSTSGTISFATKTDFASGGTSPFAITAGNLDGDSLPDIVVSNVTNNTLSVFKNTYTSGNNASFATNINFITGFYPFTAAIGDLDGDGEPDIAVPNNGNNTISVLRNLLPTSTVPVRFISFTGKYQQSTGNDLLDWQTTLEINASYFNIQRSVDGVNFTAIGKESAVGNSSLLDNYNYTDANVSTLGVNKIFYRLQEADNNGTVTYSNIVSINLSDKDNPISVFPNPANNSISVLHPGAVNNAHVQITTTDGKIIFAQTVVSGSNQTDLNVSALSKGTYIIIYSDDVHKAVTRFEKL